jgi:hypothetical protein
MARLPQPGGDQGSWGEVLNDFLSTEHNNNGTLKASGSLSTKYSKPAGGIPETDLDSSLQTKVNTVLASGGYIKPTTGIPATDLDSATQTRLTTAFYTKPGTGVPETDLTTAVQTKLNAVGGYTKPSTGIPATDLDSATQTRLTTAFYTKPGTGIPATDLNSATQTKINAAFLPVAGALVIVAQDFTTATTARCTSRTDVSVRWRGPVEPTNMLIGDEWYVTTS